MHDSFNRQNANSPNRQNTKSLAFTLIEMLIVIAIAMVLLAVSLRMNRSRIDEMKSQSERYQRYDRHTHYANILTNNNYIDNQRIQSIQWIYSGNAIDLAIQTGIDTTYTIIDSFIRRHHIQKSNNLTITKKAFELGCTIEKSNDNSSGDLQLITAGNSKSYCFTLDIGLCDLKECK